MSNCREALYARARSVAERYKFSSRRACQSITPIGVNGRIAIGATGSTFVTPITNGPASTVGDSILFKTEGSQKYLVLDIINDVPRDTQEDWGYVGFAWNGNGVKNQFESSFEVDAVNSSFFSITAIRSGIIAFPWECMPAFGPNDKVRIGLFNDNVAIAPVQLLAYVMPVPDTYKPLFVNNKG